MAKVRKIDVLSTWRSQETSKTKQNKIRSICIKNHENWEYTSQPFSMSIRWKAVIYDAGQNMKPIQIPRVHAYQFVTISDQWEKK